MQANFPERVQPRKLISDIVPFVLIVLTVAFLVWMAVSVEARFAAPAAGIEVFTGAQPEAILQTDSLGLMAIYAVAPLSEMLVRWGIILGAVVVGVGGLSVWLTARE